MSTFRSPHLAAALAAAACLCAIPASASADATAVVDATGAIVLSDDDDGNVVYLDSYGQNRILLLGFGVTPGAGCRPYHDAWNSGADCPGTTRVRVNMNGGARHRGDAQQHERRRLRGRPRRRRRSLGRLERRLDRVRRNR